MASCARSVVVVLFSAIASLGYRATAPTYSHEIKPLRLRNNGYLVPAGFYRVHAPRPPLGSTSWTHATQDSYGEAAKRHDIEFKGAEGMKDEFISSSNSGQSVDSRAAEFCAESTRPSEGDPLPLDCHSLLVYTAAALAHAGKLSTNLRQTYTITAGLVPSTSPSALVDAMSAPTWRLGRITTVSQPASGVGKPLSNAAYKGPVDLTTFLENVREYFTRRHLLLPQIGRVPFKKRTQMQQTDVAEFSGDWAGPTPAHAVEEFLHYPDDTDCPGETHDFLAADNRPAFHRVAGNSLPGQAKKKPEEVVEAVSAQKISSLHQNAHERDRHAAGTVDGKCSQCPSPMQESLRKSGASVRLNGLPQGNSPGEEDTPQLSFNSRREADPQQIRRRQGPQLEHQQPQPSNTIVGGALRRRLATATAGGDSDVAQQALERLHGAQQEVASLFATSTMPFKPEGAAPDPADVSSPTEESHRKTSKRTAYERRGKSKTTRSARSRRSKRNHTKSDIESLGAAYQRYLKEEAKAMGYNPEKWEGFPAKRIALVGALTLLGQPLLAVYVMSFTVLDQLLQLDNALEQHTVMHLRARRRLLKQFLKDAKKEREALEATAPQEAPVEGAKGHLQVDPAAYRFLDTNVLNLLRREETDK